MRRLLALMIVAVFFLGACNNDGGGGGGEDPKETLASAFAAMGDVDAQSITISVASEAASLSTLSDGAVTEEQASLVLDSSITIEATGADDPATRAVRITVNIQGTDGAEILVVGSDLYVRVDVQGLLETLGGDEASLRTAIAQAEAQGLTFVRPLSEGEFVKFAGAADLAEGATGASPDANQEEMLKQFGDAIEQEATVTSEGSDDVGEHLVASLPLRALYERLLELAPQAGQQGLPPGLVPSPEQIPEGDLSLDVWVADGKVVQMEFDVTQLGEFAAQEGGENPFEGVEQFALRVVLSEEVGEIAAPDAAAEVSSQELEALLGQLIFGGAAPGGAVPGGGGDTGGGDTGDTGIDCSIYEGLPPETFEGLPQETLDQLEALCPGVVP